MENTTCAPNCCYNQNEWPLLGLSLSQCKDYCRDKLDCTRADWYDSPYKRCYVYISSVTSTCCNNCPARGPNWISCSGPLVDGKCEQFKFFTTSMLYKNHLNKFNYVIIFILVYYAPNVDYSPGYGYFSYCCQYLPFIPPITYFCWKLQVIYQSVNSKSKLIITWKLWVDIWKQKLLLVKSKKLNVMKFFELNR